MKLFILLLFGMLSLQKLASGQAIPPDFPLHNGIYFFSNSRNDDLLARSGNAVVKQLALYMMKAPERTRFEVTYSYKLLYSNEKEGTWIFGFRLVIDSISGDVKAGVFDVSDVLKPGIASFELDLIGNDGQVLDTMSVSKLEPGKDVIFNRTVKVKPEYYSSLSDVKIKGIRFGFDEYQQISVINRLNAIKAYQAACMLCDSLLNDANRLNRLAVAPSPELAAEIFHLYGAVRILSRLYDKWAAVPGSSDPAHLQQKQKMLAYRVFLIKQLFLKQLAQGKMQKPHKNLQGLANWWVTDQVDLLTDKRFPGFAAAVFNKLGILSFSPPGLDFLNKSLVLMIKASGGNDSPQVYAWAFNDAATKEFLKQGARLISEGRYNEAAGILSNAFGMCSAIPCATCSDRLYQMQASAYYGTYFSYIGVAQKALESNLPDIASGYVEAASAFQKGNSRFIILNTEVKKLSKRLSEIWLNKGNQKLEAGKLVGALSDFEKAESASAIANAGTASGIISGKVRSVRLQIAQLRFDKSVKNVDLAQSLDEPDEVFKQLSIADRLFNTEGVSANQAYENLKSRLVIQEIERILKQSKSAISTGDCESATFLLNNSKQLIRDFQLPANTSLEKEFNSVSLAVDSCICLRKIKESILLLKDARRLADSKCFVPAASVCSHALKVMEEDRICIQDINAALSLSDSLKWPAEYQEKMLDADSLAFIGASLKSVKSYSQAGEIFARHRLDKLNLRHPSLIEFAVSKHNKDIYSQVVILLLGQGSLEESLLLLGRMKAEGYTSDDCIDTQEMVAEKFARRDGPEPNLLKLNGKLFDYTGDAEWFIYFKRMYLKVIHLKG